jgi:ribosomal-protein-alanine N-acetyltransferase
VSSKQGEARELGAAGGSGARWRVRRGNEADLPGCAELEAACFESAWTEAMLHAALDAGALLLVAREGPRAPPAAVKKPPSPRFAAYAIVRATPPEAELLRLAVHPGARRRGAARALVAATKRHLRSSAVRCLLLEVRCDNDAALGLYRGLGFERIATRRGYYADGGDALVLRSALAPGLPRSTGGS